MNYNSLWYRVWDRITRTVAKINWCPFRALFNGGKYWSLTEQDHDYLRAELSKNYYVVLTARACHLTTYLIRILSFINGNKSAYYSHSFMNVEDEAKSDMDFRIIEATGEGVHYSTFMEVFDVDAVALLKPKNVDMDDWNSALDAAKAQLGLPYDEVFYLADKTHVSCVEMVLNAIERIEDYESKFPNLIKMIKDTGNLTPQMYHDCPDFTIHWEVKR